MSHELKVYLLGLPRVEHDGQPIELKRRKATALLAYLVVTGRPHSRDALASLLWPDYDTDRARAELRRILTALNKTPLADCLTVDRKSVALAENSALWVDVRRFNDLLDDSPTPDMLAEAIDLHHDSFMAGFSLPDSIDFDNWQSLQTQNLQQKLVIALEQLTHHYIRAQEVDRAIELLQRWLATDTLYETAHRQLMRAYAFSGQRAAAMRQYETLSALLKDELDAAPQDDTQELYEAIRANRPVQLQEYAPPVFGNLPPRPGLVVGRDDALRDIKDRLGVGGNGRTPSATPIHVIRGWPGIGKSTITALLAHDPDIHEHFADGVLWASLGQSPDLYATLASWAAALEVGDVGRLHTAEDLSQRLTAVLRDRRVLIIVDDVWDAAHTPPFKIGGPHCALVITTRMNDVAQALATRSDDIYRLPILTQAHALELLNVLAPGAVTQHPDEAAELVDDLEGLPLALQVAGRLLRAEMGMGWGAADLLRELRQGAALLDARPPVDRIEPAAETSTSVRVLLDKSTALLDATDRERFALLGVFAPRPATFDLEAMSAVWAVDDARPTVRTLVERGLLEPASGGRFQMHALLVMHARTMFES